jgi:hypothetical protein
LETKEQQKEKVFFSIQNTAETPVDKKYVCENILNDIDIRPYGVTALQNRNNIKDVTIHPQMINETRGRSSSA